MKYAERVRKIEQRERNVKALRNREIVGMVDDKYFVSEETGYFCFYKPVNLENFSLSCYR